MKPRYQRRLAALWLGLYPYLKLAHLHRPVDIPLLILPGLWASWSASGGSPSGTGLLWLCGITLVLRSLLLMVKDSLPGLLGSRPYTRQGLLSALRELPLARRQALLVAAPLSLLLVVWQGGMALALCVLLCVVVTAYEYLRRKTYLGELILALGLALIIPAAYLAQGAMPDKMASLLGVAAVLFILAYRVQWAVLRLTHHVLEGDKSLALLFGASERLPIALLQLVVVFALHLAGGLASFGPHYTIGLMVALGLMGYQQWLMWRATRSHLYAAYLSNIWLAIAIFAGIAFHYLCACAADKQASLWFPVSLFKLSS